MEDSAQTTPPISTLETSPTQNPNQNPPTEQKPEKLKRKIPLLKMFIFGFVILVTILAFGLIAYLIKGQNQEQNNQTVKTEVKAPTPTPDPAHIYSKNWQVSNSKQDSNMKTFSNSLNKYSFDMPSNWKFKFNESGIVFFSPDININFESHDPPSIGEIISISTENTSDTEITLKNANIGVERNYSIFTLNKTFEIDGAKTLESFGNGEYGGANTINSQFINKGVHYTVGISFYSYKNGVLNKNMKTVYDELLSSFKFTDQSAYTDTSNWKTYNNPLNASYSLKYPNDWTIMEIENELTLYPSGYPFKAPGEPNVDNPYIKVSTVPACGKGINPTNTKQISINKVEYKKFYESNTNGLIECIKTPNNSFLEITFKLPNDTNLESIDLTYDQILSNLKFNQ